MKKSFSIFFTTVVLASTAYAQDSLVIPNDVVYKKATEPVNNEAKTMLLKELSPATVTYSLFDSAMFCGPELWKRCKENKTIAAIHGRPVTYQVELTDDKGRVTKTVTLDGKFIQEKSDFKLIWDEVIKDLSGEDIRIRRLTTKELKYYWYMIDYNLHEPIFVAETSKYKILIDNSSKKRVMFLEQLP